MNKTLLFLGATLLGALALQGATGYNVVARYPVSGPGGWDYITYDGHAHRLYVSHATQVNVLDSETGKEVGIIADTPGVHGIAIAGKLKRGFTSNGKENKVSIFDPETLKLIEKVEVGNGPDGIFYHGATKRVFTNNHGSHDMTAIDAETGKVVGTVALEGDGEQIVAGPEGTLFVALEDKSEVVAVDPATLKVKQRFPIDGGKTPTGMSFDKKNNRLFVGCRSKSMIVMDSTTGKTIKSLPIGAGVDAGAFDPESGLIYFSTGEGVLNIFQQKSADEYEDAGAVTTQPSAKTMALDRQGHRVFLPAAEMVETPATEPGKRPQRRPKDGTFAVLVVSK